MTYPIVPLRVREPRDFLAVIPYQIGYQPQDSLVLAGIRRREGGAQLGMAVRFDLPPMTGRPAGRLLASYVLALDRDSEADAVIGVVYADLPAERESAIVRPGGSAFVEHMVALLNEVGHEVIDVLWVGPRGWGSFLCDDPECCPPTGRPLHELDTSTAKAEMIFRGRRVAASLADMVALPVVPRGIRAEVDRELEAARLAQERDTVRRGYEAWARGCVLEWRRALDRLRRRERLPPPEAIARVALGVRDSWVRDALLIESTGWVEALSDDDPVMRLACRELDDDGRRMVEGIAGSLDDVPDGERMAGAQDLLAYCAGALEPAHRPALLTMLAWIEWANGRGSTSMQYLSQAVGIDPGHNLARLLQGIVGSGVMPRWVIAPR